MNDREPFGSDMRFMTYLSREEWIAVWVVSFTMELNGEVPDRARRNIGELFRWTIAHLQRDYGYEFQGVKMDGNWRLWPTVDEAIEELNVLWLLMLVSEDPHVAPPDPLLHFPNVIEWLKKNIPDFDSTPLKDTLELIRRQVADATSMANNAPPLEPDEQKAMVEAEMKRREGFAALAARLGITPEEVAEVVEPRGVN